MRLAVLEHAEEIKMDYIYEVMDAMAEIESERHLGLFRYRRDAISLQKKIIDERMHSDDWRKSNNFLENALGWPVFKPEHIRVIRREIR
jgi:hypothetical protein